VESCLLDVDHNGITARPQGRRKRPQQVMCALKHQHRRPTDHRAQGQASAVDRQLPRAAFNNRSWAHTLDLWGPVTAFTSKMSRNKAARMQENMTLYMRARSAFATPRQQPWATTRTGGRVGRAQLCCASQLASRCCWEASFS